MTKTNQSFEYCPEYEVARRAGLSLPDVEEGTWYGTPALKVRGKGFTRLWEDGETMVLRCDFLEREALMQEEPETFFITDHYRGYPAVLVKLKSVDPVQLAQLLEDAWRMAAPEKLVKAFGDGDGSRDEGAELRDSEVETAREGGTG